MATGVPCQRESVLITGATGMWQKLHSLCFRAQGHAPQGFQSTLLNAQKITGTNQNGQESMEAYLTLLGVCQSGATDFLMILD